MSTPTRLLLVPALVLAASWALTAVTSSAGADDPWRPALTELTVELPLAIGLYPGDRVLVQGVEAGEVVAVEARARHVDVALEVHDVALAQNAVATVRLRSLIGERYVELGPPWDGAGPQLASGSRLGPDRARIPMELSDVLRETGTLVDELDGEVIASLVRELATALAGRGDALTAAVHDLAEVSDVVRARADELDAGLDHLAGVVGTLAERDREITRLLDGAAAVSGALLDEDAQLDRAIEGLDEVLAAVTRFAAENEERIVALTDAFDRVGRVLAAHREDFATVVDELPHLSYGYLRAVQREEDRSYVVNQPRGILFAPNGPPLNAGPGSPEWEPVPRITHTEDSPLTPFVPYEIDLTPYTGRGPLLPSLHIGPDGVRTTGDEPDEPDQPAGPDQPDERDEQRGTHGGSRRGGPQP